MLREREREGGVGRRCWKWEAWVELEVDIDARVCCFGRDVDGSLKEGCRCEFNEWGLCWFRGRTRGVVSKLICASLSTFRVSEYPDWPGIAPHHLP